MWHLEFLGKVLQVPAPLIVFFGVLLYLGLLSGLFKVAVYFFGDEGAKWTVHTVGLPAVFVYSVIEGIWRVVSWPGRCRNRRLLREIFEIEDLDYWHQNENQRKIDTVLTSRAGWMDVAFENQEKARAARDQQALNDAEEEIHWSKTQFWSAHALARKNGFDVLEKYSDYLPSKK